MYYVRRVNIGKTPQLDELAPISSMGGIFAPRDSTAVSRMDIVKNPIA